MPFKKEDFTKRLENLRSERSDFITEYKDLSDYILAHRGRFLVSDRNKDKGKKRNTKQINNTARISARVLGAGMMSGISSPARPWFRLAVGGLGIGDSNAVKVWLSRVQSIMYEVFAQSNTYNSLHVVYSDLGVFGTAAMGIFEDFNNVIRCAPYPIGSYFIGLNDKNLSDTLYREYQMSVGQVVKQFGIDNVSNSTKQQFEKGNTESWVTVVHAVEPNDGRNMMNPLQGGFQTRSVYYELGTAAGRSSQGLRAEGAPNDSGADQFLKVSGFREFPMVTPRWDVVAEDVYATDCPGMTAIGDVKALQLGERRMYQALDTLVTPALQGPSSIINKLKDGSVQPGDKISTDDANAKLSSVYDFRPDLNSVVAINDRAEKRIRTAFFEDLFLMLAQTDRREITAREVAEKHEEKLLMLGPVLERLHTELLDPLINRTFNILQRAGVFPPPPPELGNKDLRINYVSVLAQAQRLIATGAIDRMVAFTDGVANRWPEAVHKINILDTIDEMGESLGIDPGLINDNSVVARRMAADQAAAAQQAAMEQAQAAADIASTASDANIDPNNALGAAADVLGGSLP